MTTTLPIHGGTDDGPPIKHDFSTNANPLGPPPALMQAIREADRRGYPDPDYRALRQSLGNDHEVESERILPAAGGSEAIRRLTLAAHLQGLRQVWVPQPGFGDYAQAALALGMEIRRYANAAELRANEAPALIWVCEPRNPSGSSLGATALLDLPGRVANGSLIVIDRACEPLRLQGDPTPLPAGCWELHCPNKALGLTGVRAAYLLAPAFEESRIRTLLSLAPSWVLSTEGQVLLMHWHEAETQHWISDSREQLRQWTTQQRALLSGLGWRQLDSSTHFWLAKPPGPLPDLRAQGIKLRDATSFGLPGWVRIAALAPESQQALSRALQA